MTLTSSISSENVINNTALIAMSGGVDSAVAAMLIKNDGIDCTGATMKLFASESSSDKEAQATAEQLGIAFISLDFTDSFRTHVVENFVNAYLSGSTPNPCVTCNKHLKFGYLLEKALELGKDHLATGHYARIELDGNGRFLLRKATDLSKDQSYVLYTLTQHQLSYTCFPIGALTKTVVREIAFEAGLGNAHRRESQDICFIPDGNYPKFIIDYTGKAPRNGRFVDINGRDLGENKGILHYTVGQRRGLGLAMPHPPYVLDIHPADDSVVIGKEEMLYSRVFTISNVNLIPFDNLESSLKARVKIRYSHKEQPATIHQTDDDNIRIEFDEPQRAITKGQSAVIYDGDYVVGGGVIN